MRKVLAFLVVVLLIAGGWFAWSSGAMPEQTASRVEVRDLQGTVEYRTAGAEWKAISGTTEVAEGGELRTGADGQATVRFHDRAETRLAPNTTIKLAEAGVSANQSDVKVLVELQQGRVWSRVLRLLDLDADFTVRTSDVVATVRGTAFDLEKKTGASELWVSHAAVEVTPAIEALAEADPREEALVPEGFMQSFTSKPGSKQQPIVATDDAWRKGQVAKDETFMQGAKERMRAQVEPKRRGVVGRVGRFFRERFSGAEKRKAMTLQLARADAYDVRAMADAGKQGESQAAFRTLLDEWKAKGERMPMQARRTVMAAVWRDFEDVGPKDPAYRIKQQLEEAMLETMEKPMDRLYARMILLDARLDEAGMMVERGGAKEEMMPLMEVVKNGLPNIERDWKDRATEMPKMERRRLLAKVFAIKARMRGMESKMTQMLEVPVVDEAKLKEAAAASSTKTGTPTPEPSKPNATKPPEKKPTEPTTPKPTPTPTTTDSACVSLAVAVQPNPIFVKDRATVFATVVRADGTKADVSTKTTISLLGGVGTVSGNVITGTTVGSAKVQVTCSCAGTTITGQGSVEVIASAVSLQRLQVSAGSTSLPMYGSTDLSATAFYTDGSSKDVTGSVTFTVSDGAIGTIRGATFIASQTAGTASISASYSEMGTRMTGATAVTVTGGMTKP